MADEKTPFEKIEWTALEYIHVKRSPDWYWAVGVIAVAIATGAIIYHDFLFALFIILGGIILITYTVKPPRTIHYELNKDGIKIENYLYPYGNIKGFNVEEGTTEHKLVFESGRVIMPIIVVPLPEMDGEFIREVLLPYIPEKDIREPSSHKIMDSLGF